MRETVRSREGKRWINWLERGPTVTHAIDDDGVRRRWIGGLDEHESALYQMTEPGAYPALERLRRSVANWRFYHTFRTDPDSPLRRAQSRSFSRTLEADGSNVSATLASTIWRGAEGRGRGQDGVREEISRAFGGVEIQFSNDFELQLLDGRRIVRGTELSDGQLRYLCLLAALTSLRQPELMVFNEPETSLYAELLPRVGDLLVRTAEHSQVVATTHSSEIADRVRGARGGKVVRLQKVGLATRAEGWDPRNYYRSHELDENPPM